MNERILQTENLTKKYKSRVAVDSLSLEVEKGDIFGFLGQNGAGKSTTIRMALGLVRPTSGRVLLLGHDVSKHPSRALARTGAIIETPAFYEKFSGLQNLKMLSSMSGGAKQKRIEEVLEIVSLKERAKDPVQIYSHGMRQRLGIAQSLLPSPEFIILDEPTDGLDPQGIHEMRHLIHRLRDEFRITVMLSSHLLNEVEQICNRVAIIDKGRLIYQGYVEKLVANGATVKLTIDRVEDAYNLLANIKTLSVNRNGDGSLHLKIASEHIPDINALLVGNGIRVTEISLQRETLEQVFLRLLRTSPFPCD